MMPQRCGYGGLAGRCCKPGMGFNPIANVLREVAGNEARRGRNNIKGKPVLTYFDAIGLGEQVRWCFIIGEVPFVDRRITPEEWVKHYKQYSPTGRVPFLEVNGKILVESQALLKYAAGRAGLLPSTPEEAFKADMLVEMMESDRETMRAKGPDDFPDIASRRKYYVESMTAVYPAWCDKFEGVLTSMMKGEDNKAWVVGDKMTYADVYVAASIARAEETTGLKLIPNGEKYPIMSKIYSSVVEHPHLLAYIEDRKKMSEKPVLYHFAHGADAHPIMWALKIGKVDFEEKVVTKEEWVAGVKAKSPSGKLPMLEVGGEKYVETIAILQYAAKRAQLMPDCAFMEAHAWAVTKVCSEFRDVGAKIIHAADSAAKKACIEKCVEVTIPQMLARVEKIIGQHQDAEGHVVCNKLTYADLWVAQTVVSLHHAAEHGIVLKDLELMAPNMHKTFRMVSAIQAVQAHGSAQLTKEKPALTYFDFPGRAEAVRYAMKLGDIEFEDQRLTREEWAKKYKAQSPTGQCPVLTVGLKKIVEAKAILQWVQEVAPQLKPTGKMGRVVAEQLVSSWGRVHKGVMMWFSIPEGDRDAMKFHSETLKPALDIQELLWADSKIHEGYSVGDKMTWVDAWVAGELEFLREKGLIPEEWQAIYPTLSAIYRRVTSHPNVAAYRAAHNN